MGVIFGILMFIYEQRWIDCYPESYIVHILNMTLYVTEKNPDKWNEKTFKLELIKNLEKIASCLEKNFHKDISTNSLGTNLWLKETSSAMAQKMRLLINWIFTPMYDTRDQFIQSISKYLSYSAIGEWDAFGKESSLKSDTYPPLEGKNLKKFAISILTALTPILLLYVIKFLKLLEGPPMLYLTVGAYIWAGISIVSHLDPLYSAKIAALKDIGSLLPIPGKEKGK